MLATTPPPSPPLPPSPQKRIELVDSYARVIAMIEIEVEMEADLPAAEVLGGSGCLGGACWVGGARPEGGAEGLECWVGGGLMNGRSWRLGVLCS